MSSNAVQPADPDEIAKKAAKMTATERERYEQRGKNTAFCRIPMWMHFLDLTPLERIVLGRVYSFQCTSTKTDEDHVYRMTMSKGAAELNLSGREQLRKILNKLVAHGFLIKVQAGKQATACYKVDVPFCLLMAENKGYVVKPVS